MSYKQHSPPHPGAILMEFYFRPLKLSVKTAAKKLDMSMDDLTLIVDGRKAIGAATAEKLAACFNTTAKYWLNMQANFDA